MKEVCELVTPPSPLFFVSVDFRGLTRPASCLESISLELIDSKGVGERAVTGLRGRGSP